MTREYAVKPEVLLTEILAIREKAKLYDEAFAEIIVGLAIAERLEALVDIMDGIYRVLDARIGYSVGFSGT